MKLCFHYSLPNGTAGGRGTQSPVGCSFEITSKIKIHKFRKETKGGNWVIFEIYPQMAREFQINVHLQLQSTDFKPQKTNTICLVRF